jgi:hypothetical protein
MAGTRRRADEASRFDGDGYHRGRRTEQQSNRMSMQVRQHNVRCESQ